MKMIVGLIVALAAMPAWADFGDELDYPAGQRRLDEIEAKYPPLGGSIRTREDLDDYIQKRDQYEQAMQRLTLYEMKKMRKEMEEEREQQEYDRAIRNLGR
jgi:hypothetical protein